MIMELTVVICLLTDFVVSFGKQPELVGFLTDILCHQHNSFSFLGAYHLILFIFLPLKLVNSVDLICQEKFQNTHIHI